MKSIKKVLIISTEFPPGPGGIGNHAWNLSRNINTNSPVHVITVSDYVDKLECSAFDKKEQMYIYRFNRYKLSIITFAIRLYDILRHLIKHRYSHCILSGRFALYMSSIIRLFTFEIKLIGIVHGSELLPSTKTSKLLLVMSLKTLNTVVSVSKYTDSLIPDNSIDKSIRFVIPNGVNTELFIKTKFKRTVNMIGHPCLLTVGSITHRKGQINLVKSLPLIIEQYPKVHYHCIGLPLEKAELLNTSKQLGVEKHLTLHGYLPNNLLNEMYRQSDILIMLSQNEALSDVEGFGIVILEANLCGVSAIGSKGTGMEDAIVHNETGLLIDPYEEHEILQAIDHILNKKEMFLNNTVEWAKTHNWKNITSKYLEVIENA